MLLKTQWKSGNRLGKRRNPRWFPHLNHSWGWSEWGWQGPGPPGTRWRWVEFFSSSWSQSRPPWLGAASEQAFFFLSWVALELAALECVPLGFWWVPKKQEIVSFFFYNFFSPALLRYYWHITLCEFRCEARWSDTVIYGKMIRTRALTSSIPSHNTHFFFVMRIFMIHSLASFKYTYNEVLRQSLHQVTDILSCDKNSLAV